MMFH